MAMQNGRVLAPSLLEQTERNIKEMLNNYDKTGDAYLISKIASFKGSIADARPLLSLARKDAKLSKNLNELDQTMKMQDHSNSELDFEGLQRERILMMIDVQRDSANKREELLSSMPKNKGEMWGELSVEIAARMRSNKGYEKEVVKSFRRIGIRSDVSKEVLEAISA